MAATSTPTTGSFGSMSGVGSSGLVLPPPGAAPLAARYKAGVVEVTALQQSQAGPSTAPCEGKGVVIARVDSGAANGACPTDWVNVSCSCITDTGSEWAFQLKKRTATTALPVTTNPATTALEITTIGRFTLPKKVTTLRLLGVTSSDPISLSFDLTSPEGTDNAVSLVKTGSENHITTVEVANIDFSHVDFMTDFLPSSVATLTMRNCNLNAFPTPYLTQKWDSLTTVDLSGNKLTLKQNAALSGPDAGRSSIATLNLSSNAFEAIPSFLAALPSLENVNFSNNPVINFTLDETLFNKIANLQTFSLDGVAAVQNCSEGSTLKTAHNVSFCVATSGISSGSTTTTTNISNSSSTSPLVYVAIGGGIVVLVLAIALFAMNRRHRRRERDKAFTRTFDVDSPHSRRGGFESIPSLPSGGISLGSKTRAIDSSLLNDPLIITSRLSHKELIFGELIKQGGFGSVYSGVYKRRRVAIKMIRPEYTNDTKLVESFLKEIALMASLKHPRIVEYIGCAWEDMKTLSMVTELMQRGDLHEVLASFKERNASLTWTEHKLRIALHVAEALEYLHTLSPKVIHRDLKSKNVLVNNDLDAKLTDFGISREGRFEQTHMTAGIGTSFWIAPEVLAGLRYDERADIFSFGVVLSEIDTDDYPYWNDRSAKEQGHVNYGETQQAVILRKVLAGEMRPGFSAECPQAILELADSCMDGDPTRRPSAGEIVEYLKRLSDRR